ncbi:MAG: radical SAM protein [Candidatus Diapherotrites archaeon]|nr:radical SAM protein [Candidatus Diapherotrites archaeon]
MKILMLNPPFLNKFSRTSRSPAISKGGCVYYPIWMGYATGILEQEGHDVKLVDATAASLTHEQAYKIAEDFSPELMVIDSVTASFHNDVFVAGKLKDMFPESFVMMVGDMVTAIPNEAMQASEKIDALARGEYDFTVRDVAMELKQKKDMSKVLGLTFRDKNNGGKIVSNPDREPISGEELDKFPFVSEVYSRHLNIEDYFYPSVLYPEVTIITGRGCYYRCTFCKWPQLLTYHSYRARSVKNLVDEFEWIRDNLPQVKDIMIEDDTLTQDGKRTMELCQEIKNRGLKTTWTCNARADLDYELMRNMKEAGCRLMCVGFESADQQILNNIRKGTNIEKIKQFMNDSKRARILVHGCFMMGNNGETKETVRKTTEFAKELDPDTAQFFPVMVYPGTEAYRWAEENGFLTTKNWNEWLKPDGTHNTIVSTDKMTAQELVDACDRARIEFYLRPKFMARKLKQIIVNPKDIPRTAISTMVFAKYLKQHIQKSYFGSTSKTLKSLNSS